jgi:histidyl-tRNA synthetase
MDILSIIFALLGGFGINEVINNIADYKIHKNRIKFETIYKRRIEIFSEISKKIYNVEKSFKSLMNIFQGAEELSKLEKGKIAANSANDFLDYLNENRIYLSESSEDKFDSINGKLKEVWAEHQAARWDDKNPDIQKWVDSWKKIQEDVPAMNKEVRKEFRKIMGIK